jgi:hypothetical protein
MTDWLDAAYATVYRAPGESVEYSGSDAAADEIFRLAQCSKPQMNKGANTIHDIGT